MLDVPNQKKNLLRLRKVLNKVCVRERDRKLWICFLVVTENVKLAFFVREIFFSDSKENELWSLIKMEGFF